MFGVVATYLSNQSGISFSGVEAIDAFVISAGVYWFLCQFNHQTN
ncbi:hypothetical protein [Psychrosphaera algicola]|uniref:Uncharacterized protein n=2 Tax=Psychrosphaera TaxID=907197 RepID=A0ABT5FIG3_9GAMM|nr:hypothetical protein [Psychrosphaera sp. G1-22]MDC2890993.1 hypothetical protein [Psychrosphaera sp. G1-22]